MNDFENENRNPIEGTNTESAGAETVNSDSAVNDAAPAQASTAVPPTGASGQVPPTYTASAQYTVPPQYGAPTYQPPQYGQPPQPAYYQPQYTVPPIGYPQKSRMAAGLLGILFGAFGVHNFYMGFNTKATVQLIVALAGGILTCGLSTLAVGIWGFVEGVLIISGSPNHLFDGNNVILKN